MRLLIDANILLDVLQDREPFVRDSARVWKMCEIGEAECYSTAGPGGGDHYEEYP